MIDSAAWAVYPTSERALGGPDVELRQLPDAFEEGAGKAERFVHPCRRCAGAAPTSSRSLPTTTTICSPASPSTPTLVERLRRLSILYDRDSAGEYFHIYSASFADRFFFEIVQRSNYYAYGAVNAPARTASQEQADARP